MNDFKDILEEPNYKKYYKYIGFGILIIILIASIIIYNISKNNKKEVKKQSVESVSIEQAEEKKDNEAEISHFRVDIKGNILNPGVYELDEGKRVIDVINMAGGLTDDADTSLLNLSKKITDEMVIIIYSKEEINNQKEKNIQYIYINEECTCPDNLNDACINSNNSNNTSNTKANEKKETDKVDNSTQEKSSIISINKATSEELQTLPGVGESKAKSIIKYREENGIFNTIDEIKNVSGIGDALFEKIKDYITC